MPPTSASGSGTSRETKSGRARSGASCLASRRQSALRIRRHPETPAPRRSRRPPAGARDGDRGRGWRQIPDRIPVGAAGWRDPVDFVPGPRRVRRHGPAGPDPRRRSRHHRAQTGRAGDAAAAAGDRARRARLDDGPARRRRWRTRSISRSRSILRNAEAAELFLQHPSPDLDEIRAILADIRSDDERAGHVIDRMRGLLKRQHARHAHGSTWARSSAMSRRSCGSMRRRGR